MVIPSQYDHYVYVQEETEATLNDNGDYVVSSEPGWELLSKGREETNGKGLVVETADVLAYKFSCLVQMPNGVRKVNEGTRVLVAEKELGEADLQQLQEGKKPNAVRVIGTCAKFDNGKLHCRMWL